MQDPPAFDDSPYPAPGAPAEPALAGGGPHAGRPELHTFAFVGSGVAFFALVIKNMLLSLVTLGVYLPWAKTERRQYLWQNIEIAGHRLRYHGTGKELFIGYLKVIAGYLVFVGTPLLVGKVLGKVAGGVVQAALFLAVLLLIPFAIWGSRRYLLSRTSWRGVRFRLGDGSGQGAKRFARVFVFGYLFTILSLGLFGPVWANRMHAVLLNATALGTKSFEYRGEDKVVFKMTLKALPLILLTLGVYYFWYLAKLSRYQTENTWFDGARGDLEITGGEILQLVLLQILAVTFSLGLAFPWVTTYSLRFYLARMRFVGPIRFAQIYQADSQGDASADGLADALDVGIAL
ncbi:MAG: hypothetical protein RLZZ450_6540 [Pseudomonadota bacterium]|jgi:uncharacterized membrane protein YjgN (DUF898 family)